jgi:hypothetical protein
MLEQAPEQELKARRPQQRQNLHDKIAAIQGLASSVDKSFVVSGVSHDDGRSIGGR